MVSRRRRFKGPRFEEDGSEPRKVVPANLKYPFGKNHSFINAFSRTSSWRLALKQASPGSQHHGCTFGGLGSSPPLSLFEHPSPP